jgi:branched-chain amino acid aminotransferase
MLAFLNGKFLPEAEAVVPVNDRGFMLGDGLFETMRVANGKAFRLTAHLERLARGAEFLKIHLPFDLKEIQKFMALLIEKNRLPEAVLRLTLTRGSGGRGYSAKNCGSPTLVMTLHRLPPADPGELRPWSLITSSHKISAGDRLANIKTSSKILNVLARAEAEERGADEALLLDSNGTIVETAGGNIFWIDRDAVGTVLTELSGLPGITRAVVMEICRTLGLAMNQRVITPEQLRQMEGVFITQSALGIIPVATFDGQPVPPSPRVRLIANAYDQLLQQECF